MTALAIILATLVSEDLTCVTVGLLISRGEVDPFLGTLACAVGIYVGDIGVWLSGRLAGLALLGRLRQGRFSGPVERFSRWYAENAAAAVFVSRFLPGARLPLRLAIGATGLRPVAFLIWAALATLAWTPLLVGAAALFGDAFVRPFEAVVGSGWMALVAGAVTAVVLLRLLTALSTAHGRARLKARLARLWRWEFWPMWAFYPPVALWVAVLAVRYGGVSVITAANPAIPTGGFVGESKHEILSKLPREWTLESHLVDRGEAAARTAELTRIVEEKGWAFPIVLKPDVGQRGAGVKVVATIGEAAAYLAAHESPVVAQVYHAGPYEAGVFYYRYPGEPSGRIFSITDKHFPQVVGDGRSTLADLIWRHPRYRMQGETFLTRHARQVTRVPAAGEVVPLALAGNHVQGTMFRDGAHLVTAALERRIDAIAQTFAGFYVGRFDVRYRDVAAFLEGRDLAIVELNGVSSESTNIYDPDKSIFWAYRTLFRQWAIIFRIGAINRARGEAPPAGPSLLRSLVSHFRSSPPFPISD